MITDHEHRPYAAFPSICVAELASGETCNKMIEDHLTAAPTDWLLEHYREHDDDDSDAVLEELHRRAMNGNRAAREVLNDYDRDDPDWTPQTGSEARD